MSAVLKLVQGSAEWHEHRQSMRNASETPAVLGISPWVTPYGPWLVKTGRSTQAVTEAMAHGTRMEPEARAAYEAHTSAIMQPLVPMDDTYIPSLDSLDQACDLILEFKCPVRGRR